MPPKTKELHNDHVTAGDCAVASTAHVEHLQRLHSRHCDTAVRRASHLSADADEHVTEILAYCRLA